MTKERTSGQKTRKRSEKTVRLKMPQAETASMAAPLDGYAGHVLSYSNGAVTQRSTRLFIAFLLLGGLLHFFDRDDLSLYNNEIKGVDALEWEAFPRALVVSGGQLRCEDIDRLERASGET